MNRIFKSSSPESSILEWIMVGNEADDNLDGWLRHFFRSFSWNEVPWKDNCEYYPDVSISWRLDSEYFGYLRGL